MVEVLSKLLDMLFILGSFFFIAYVIGYLGNIILFIKERINNNQEEKHATLNPLSVLKFSIKNDEPNMTEKTYKRYLIFFLTLSIIGGIFIIGIIGARFNIIGNTNIGSNFEKHSYEEEYYVLIQEYIPFTKTPEYMIKAKIIKEGEYYYIGEVKHPDGYNLDFRGSYIELDSDTFCDDQYRDTWLVTLTNKKVD